jgi:hypothetical protein
VPFAATANWRRRWRKRFRINPCRRKSNVKNKSFADSEPVLLKYFRGLRRRLQLEAHDEAPPPESDEGEELEPEDVNPEREDDEDVVGCGQGDSTLDSSDDETNEAELFTFESALGEGLRVAPAPTPEQLEFKHASAKELKDKVIVYNWAGFGWCMSVSTPGWSVLSWNGSSKSSEMWGFSLPPQPQV